MLIKRGFKMKKELLQLKFSGSNDIDLETLSESLNCMVSTLSKIADYSLQENDFCKFKVKSISQGSFIITIEQIVEMAAVLFPYMPPILETFNNILALRKTLGGQLPEKVERNGDSVKITAKSGANVNVNQNVFNIYTTEPNIEKNLSNISRILSNDSDRTGLSVEMNSERGVNRIEMDHDDLLRTSKTLDVQSMNDEIEENLMTTTLKIKQPDLEGNSKWKFKFNGKTISVEISDTAFMELVKSGKIDFHSGMKMKVEMLVRCKNDVVINYIILKVIEITK